MRKVLHLSLALALLLTITIVSPALAAKPAPSGGTKNPLGMDISYPQCGKSVPTDQAFGIVGINGGNAASTNPCLSTQLAWASKSSSAAPNQDNIQVYVNTANPGQVKDQMTSRWPDANTAPVTNPYGTCDGDGMNKACSWQYGWDRGQYAVDYFVAQAAVAQINPSPSAYKWWLDVETMNTWQTGSQEALANNVAALEGWADFFTHNSARVGLYSTAVQWKEITGNLSGTGKLNGLDNWRPGGASQATAKQACTAAPLTPGGKVVLTQFVSRGLDYDHSCIN